MCQTDQFQTWRIILLILGTILIPVINNLKIDNHSIGISFLSGLIFGIITFDMTFRSPLYWIVILTLNIFFLAHRVSYRNRKSIETDELSTKRDSKLSKLLGTKFDKVKSTFLQ
jgi:membrane-bound ClpP family serine protease